MHIKIATVSALVVAKFRLAIWKKTVLFSDLSFIFIGHGEWSLNPDYAVPAVGIMKFGRICLYVPENRNASQKHKS